DLPLRGRNSVRGLDPQTRVGSSPDGRQGQLWSIPRVHYRGTDREDTEPRQPRRRLPFPAVEANFHQAEPRVLPSEPLLDRSLARTMETSRGLLQLAEDGVECTG